MKPVTNLTAVPLFVRYPLEERNKCAELLREWRKWVAFGEPGSGERRDLAFERLKDCLVYRHSWLGMSGLGLTTLPEPLPDFLQELDVSDNRLTCLPETLPDLLEILNIDGNRLSALPAHLPACLISLDVSNNRLTHLSATLPVALKDLDASINYLTFLPAALPAELETLDVSENNLDCLPEVLPVTLKTLNISDNALHDLPTMLPAFLKTLDINRNRLTTLPVRLPEGLETLDVSYNQLTRLPANLPVSLRTLDISHNQLMCLPVSLPDALEMVFIDNNPLENTAIALNSHPLIRACCSCSVADFLAKIRCWDNGIDRKLWKAIYAEDNSVIFADFLHKLYQGKNNQNEALRHRIANWLRYLADPAQGQLRKQTFVLASEATESCVDRASFYFNHMHILLVEHQLLGEDVPLTQVLETIKGTFRLQILERLAAEKTAIRRRDSPSFSEDLEIYLAYQYKLRERLSLPVYTELQFEQIAGLSDEDIDQAQQRVMEAEKTHFVRYWLTESALWTAKLANWHSEKKAEVDNRYLETISSAHFNKAVRSALTNKGINPDDIDAHRNVSQTLAADLFYQQRYCLTREFFIAHQALSLFAAFHFPCWLMTQQTTSVYEINNALP